MARGLVIAKSAIRRFLERPLRDSAKAKLFTSEALNAKLDQLDPPPKFHTTPRKHQKVGFLLGLKYPGYMFTWDMGLGKTWLMLNLFRYRRRQANRAGKIPPRMLVLVPAASNVQGWVDEVKIHAPMLSVTGVDAVGSAERMLQVKGQSDIIVITYVGFLALVCSGKPVTLKDDKGKEILDVNGDPILKTDKDGNLVTKGWKLDKKKLKVFKNLFDFFVGDESTHYRNHQSLVYRAVKQMAWACTWRYGLAGKPYGKKVDALWAQFYVVDKGETLGPTMGLFRAALFTATDNFWSGGVDYKFDERKRAILNRMLRHGSLRYKKNECLDLPPKVYTTRTVVFDPETWTYYDRLVEQIRASQGAVKVVDSAFLRMRQLTAGYLVLKDAEGGKQVIRFKKAPKIEALIEMLQEVPEDTNAIIFHEYILTGEAISAAMSKAKLKHVWLYSGTPKKAEAVAKFLTGKVPFMLSSSAGAFGGNWQRANYVFFVESPTDPIIRGQEEDRVYRMGQDKTVVITDLAVRGSVDEAILESHRAGEDLFDALIEGRVDLSRPKSREKLRS